MANNEFLEDLEAAEARLLELYHKVYGGNGSPFRQYKSFLLTGQRSKNGRKIIANFKPSSLDTGKEQGVNKGSESPVLPLSRKTLAVLLSKQQEQGQSGAAAAAEGSDIKDDILKMSITAVVEKYTADEIKEVALNMGATMSNVMNSKQLVKFISSKLKADESKG